MSVSSTPQTTHFVKLRWVKPLHLVNLIGTMGSGKTTLLRKLYSLYKVGRRSDSSVSVYFQYKHDKKLIEKFWDTIKELEGYRYVFIAIDDISFTGYDKLTRSFMRSLTKVRHINRTVDRWVIATAMHYSKATLPFLRFGHTKILTSLTDPEEIENLRWTFTTKALWDYYFLYTSDPFGHWVLVNWLGQIFISKVYRPRHRCWDIVVSGPKCV